LADAPSPPRKPGAHTLADHAFGALARHAHAPGEEADHDHDADDGLVLDPRENVETPLVSMGVDVGSSGVQIVFSRLLMRGPGEPLAMRRQAKARETLFVSPVSLTPFKGDFIDGARLRDIVDRAFVTAGVTPDDVETGVVIMTGAAARKDNAATILNALAQEAGELVAAAAGDHMEAMLAAYGSGAVERSRREMTRLVNIDIGGATTKIALIENGRVRAVAALDIGGRQIAFDAENRIARLDPPGAAFLRRAGLDWGLGARVDKEGLRALADLMADDLFDALFVRPMPEAARALFVTEPILDFGAVDGVIFSGGVAEYVYHREARDFGDMGWRLGRAIRWRWDQGRAPWALLEPGECIRATALGASEYSVQMSGQTSYVSSHPVLLPRRNLPVLQPVFDFSGEIVADRLAVAIAHARALFDDDDPAREIALALRWRGDASWERVRALAHGVAQGLADRVAAGTALYLMCEGDVAASLGAMLREEMGLSNHVLVLDGVVLRDFDYVDIGRIRMPSAMIPVTVKSLVFGAPGGGDAAL
jgi:ethanolamine utilization protein EutA